MKKHFLLLFLLFISFCFAVKPAKAQVNQSDSLALVDFYNSTNGTNWYFNYNWLTKAPVSTWAGITTTGTRVTQIDLENDRLSGTLPVSFGNLTGLQYLNIANNQLSGSLPSSLGNLVNLTELDIYSNLFSGSLPSSLGNLKKVQYFEIGFNGFTGTIPASFGKLSSVLDLGLGFTHLSGAIPVSVLQLPSLKRIAANNCDLTQTGNIPLVGPARSFQMQLQYNNYTFDGLEYVAVKTYNSTYGNQARITVHQHGVTLAVSAGGTLKNNTYTWYKVRETGGTTIAGDSTFIPAASGKYYAAITNSIATKLTLLTDTISYTHSLTGNEAKLNLSLYPNPVKNYLTVNGLDAKSNIKITVADVSGRIWISKMSQNQATLTCDVSQLKAGNYLVNVMNGNAVQTLQFIKE